jgi:hypothetical protein
MRKITLLLMTLLTGFSASAKQTAIFKGELSSGGWTSTLSLDKDLFASVEAGDILYMKWSLDTEAAIANDGENHDYYQFNISFPYDTWSDKLVANTDVKYTSTHYAVTLTADEVTKLQTYGMAISARYLNITDVVIGDAFSQTEIQYWGTDAWETASTTNFEMPSGSWPSCVLNGETIKSANIGDRLTVTFTPGGASLWDAQLQVINASGGWTTLMGIPVGGLTSMSLLVDEDVYTAFQKGDIRLSGTNLTITNIQLETTTLYYRLSAYDTNVDITKLPTETTVNIDLYRRFDWQTTLCLPFDVPSVSDAFGSSTKAYEFARYNSGLVFTEREHIEAGKPYFMTFNMGGIEEANKVMTTSFTDVTINTTLNNSDESGGLTFKGNYTPSMSMTGNYGVACVKDGDEWVWGFYKGGTNTYLNAFSSYFEGSITTSRLSIIFDEETTNIGSALRSTTSNGNFYTLNGQRVIQPAKGLYIVNGKIMVIK